MKQFKILTTRSTAEACKIEDPERAELYREELVKEQNKILESFGYGDTIEKAHLIHFFASVFYDESIEEMTIDEAIQALAMKEGADLVKWESGEIGFLGYYNEHLNGFEISKKSPLKICPHCLQAIKSHGEKVVILDNEYTDPTPCEWCKEETDDIYKVTFI